jgi:hypothetical protein
MVFIFGEIFANLNKTESSITQTINIYFHKITSFLETIEEYKRVGDLFKFARDSFEAAFIFRTQSGQINQKNDRRC